MCLMPEIAAPVQQLRDHLSTTSASGAVRVRTVSPGEASTSATNCQAAAALQGCRMTRERVVARRHSSRTGHVVNQGSGLAPCGSSHRQGAWNGDMNRRRRQGHLCRPPTPPLCHRPIERAATLKARQREKGSLLSARTEQETQPCLDHLGHGAPLAQPCASARS